MRLLKQIAAGVALLASVSASAQYFQIANQLPSLISPAVSGSFNYRGYVDVSGVAGVGTNRANFLGVSTSQGFQYASWFFMGAGIGVDVAMTNRSTAAPDLPSDQWPGFLNHDASQTKAMIPIFSDFRFNFGGGAGIGGFVDIKAGATWLIGDSYLELAEARMGGGAQFYLKPTIGIRVPLSASNPRQAVNIGVTYQLITSDNYYSWYHDNSVTLNSFGATIAFEW